MDDLVMDVLYPNIKVPLTGQDGNSFFIIGRVRAALRRGGVSAERCDEFTTEVISGDYDTVMRTAMRWVVVS